MKLIFIALTAILAFGVQAQTLVTISSTSTNLSTYSELNLFNGILTNGGSIQTISNGVIVATMPLQSPAPPLVNTNGQASPDGLIAAIALETGIPIGVLKVVPFKWLLLLAALIFIVPYAGRAWHAWQADGGWKGIFNSVLFGTNTPKQIVQDTGQPVVPASVPEEKINSTPKTT